VKVTVLYWAQAFEATGVHKEEVSLKRGSLRSLADQLLRRHPGLAGLMKSITFAVNGELVGKDGSVKDGDEVALLPPVAGG
jgi:molybdopterin converting factor subunit 1